MDVKDRINQSEKELEQLRALTERFFGMRVLTAFQCLYCGHIMDDMETAVRHVPICPKHLEIKINGRSQ